MPGAFRMYLVADGRYDVKDDKNRVGKLHDAVTEYGLSTTIGVFVRGVPKDMDDPAVAVLDGVGQVLTETGVDPGAVLEERPGEYLLAVEATPAVVADLAVWLRDHHVRLGELRAGRRTLEEVFLRVTSEARP